jgi:transcription elongation GreA/GreB family factor
LAELKSRAEEFQQERVVSAPSAVAPQKARSDEPLGSVDEDVAPGQIQLKPKAARRIEIGDTVRFRYLTDDKRSIRVTISNAQSDPSRGIIHYRTPVASALIGAEEGDEVEVLVGSYIRPALIESISKSVDINRDKPN